MSKKNPRFRLCKVKTIIPSEYVKEIMVNSSTNHFSCLERIDNCSFDIRKNCDDNTSLIQKQFDSLRNYVEKSFVLNFIVLLCIMLTLVLS